MGADSGDHAPALRGRASDASRRVERLGVRFHARHRACAASNSAWSGSAGSARAVAARASAFGMRVACSTRRESEQSVDWPAVARSAAEHVRHRVAARSAHAETRHLIDKRALTRMKRSAYLINTARGPVIDEEALAWALEHRLIAGAALDVYEHEPEVHPDSASARERAAGAASRQRHDRNAHRNGRSRGRQRRGRSQRTAAADAGARLMPRRSATAEQVEPVMRALARAIDGLELPAVEKISESAAGRSVSGPDRDAAVGAHAGRDDAGGFDAAVQGCANAAHDGEADRQAHRAAHLSGQLLSSQSPPREGHVPDVSSTLTAVACRRRWRSC